MIVADFRKIKKGIIMAKKILFLLVALSNIGVISLSVDIVVYLNGKRMLEMTTSVQQLVNLLNDDNKLKC